MAEQIALFELAKEGPETPISQLNGGQGAPVSAKPASRKKSKVDEAFVKQFLDSLQAAAEGRIRRVA